MARKRKTTPGADDAEAPKPKRKVQGGTNFRITTSVGIMTVQARTARQAANQVVAAQAEKLNVQPGSITVKDIVINPPQA